MKNFIPIDQTFDKASATNNFLDSLDTDISNSHETCISEDYTDNNKANVTASEEASKEITALIVQKPNSLFVAQTMFKKSIKISIKSFLISLSLGFLNLFF